jgi:hypothetical protein
MLSGEELTHSLDALMSVVKDSLDNMILVLTLDKSQIKLGLRNIDTNKVCKHDSRFLINFIELKPCSEHTQAPDNRPKALISI